MTITLNGTSGIVNDATDLNYTGTLTGGAGVVNLGSGQVYKDASGNVGIGTSNPSSALTVGAGGIARFNRADNNTYNEIKYVTAGDLFYFNQANGGAYQFNITGAERARIDSSGNLLVGTTSSVGRIAVLADSGNNVAAFRSAGAVSATRFARFDVNTSTEVGSIQYNGTGTSYITTSDYRLKENVQPMVGALAKIAALKPCVYTWKSSGERDEGFIAHELADVCPRAVSGEKDAVNEDGSIKPQGIDTSFLIATLTAAIQEQQTTIVSLQDTLTALTTRLTALEGTAA